MSVTGQGADPLSCTILVKPIIRVGLFSVTMVRGAFACATHDGLLAGVLASNSELPAFTPALRVREPPCAVGGMHFLVYLKGEELRLPSHLTSNIKLLRCCHPTPLMVSLYPGEEAFPRSQRVGNWRFPASPNVDSQVVKASSLPPHPLFRTQFRGNGSHKSNRYHLHLTLNLLSMCVFLLCALVRVHIDFHGVRIECAFQSE